MKVGILTGGGDAPGLNAVIYGALLRAFMESRDKKAIGDLDVIGIKKGWKVFALPKEQITPEIVQKYTEPLIIGELDDLHTKGGTILFSSRTNPFKGVGKLKTEEEKDGLRKQVGQDLTEKMKILGLDATIAVGGDDTCGVAAAMCKYANAKVVACPKTIDNDLMGTDVTFGYDSALTTATEAIDKIHTTAQSHHRVMVIEVMGRYAGWLSLGSGIAGGGDIILIPEIPYDINFVCQKIKERNYQGKHFSILVVGEGAKPKGGDMVVKRTVDGSPEPIRLGGIGHKVADDIENVISVETRVTVLGHLLRGGVPTPADRLLATRFGVAAARLIEKNNYGKMVALRGDKISSVPISEVAGKTRTIPLDSPLLTVARSVGTCLGDDLKCG